jgi:hypothetical protein
MEHKNEGLTLIYDTPDAPVPQGLISRNADMSITAILKPLCPSNAVTIYHKINGGPPQRLRAVAEAIDYKEKAQYFHATFPTLNAGEVVDYTVIGSCAGRQVPNPAVGNKLLHSFRVVDPNETNTHQPNPELEAQPLATEPPRFQVYNEFLARFTVTIEPPQIVGPTPDGIRVTWNAVGGTVIGPKLNAKVIQGADWMQIRPDGVGDIDVRAILETAEGARIMSIYSGVMEWGEDGYQRFLRKNFPKPLKAWTAQRFLTADSTYSWLNRVQCLSVGEVFLDDLNYIYDVYTLK